MTLARRQFMQLAACAAVLSAKSGIARAQAYPTRPITIVSPFAAGGPVDIIARVLAEKMRDPLGQSIVVEDVTGAGGSIGVGRVARAAPDGYTLCVGNNGSNVLTGALYSLPFDLLTDFEPIAKLTTNSQIIIGKKAIPAQNLTELIAWIKENQDHVSIGSGGPLATVNEVVFQRMTSTQFQIVPYRGAAPAIQDLISGQIDLMIDQVSNAAAQIKAGTVQGYAVAASTRSPAVPDIPTVDEAGLPGFYGSFWNGMWAPKGTPAEVIAKLNAAVRYALADPAVQQRLALVDQEIVPLDQQSPAALAADQTADIEKLWPIAKAANLKGD